MFNLGELFPKDFKTEIARQAIEISVVLRAFTEEIKNPKVKRFVVVGVNIKEDKVGVVLINSNISLKLFGNRQDLLDLQFSIKAGNNEFLDRMSHIDCTKILLLSYKKILQGLEEGRVKVLGKVQNDDMREIFSNVIKSPMIAKNTLELFEIQ